MPWRTSSTTCPVARRVLSGHREPSRCRAAARQRTPCYGPRPRRAAPRAARSPAGDARGPARPRPASSKRSNAELSSAGRHHLTRRLEPDPEDRLVRVRDWLDRRRRARSSRRAGPRPSTPGRPQPRRRSARASPPGSRARPAPAPAGRGGRGDRSEREAPRVTPVAADRILRSSAASGEPRSGRGAHMTNLHRFEEREAEEYLDARSEWAVLTTIDEDGYPHSVALGYYRIGDAVYVGTPAHTRKVRKRGAGAARLAPRRRLEGERRLGRCAGPGRHRDRARRRRAPDDRARRPAPAGRPRAGAAGRATPRRGDPASAAAAHDQLALRLMRCRRRSRARGARPQRRSWRSPAGSCLPRRSARRRRSR